MATPRPTADRRPSRTPLWVIEGLDVVELRAGAVRLVAGGVCAVAVVLALVAPGLVPPTPLVGAAVGVAALLLGLAVAVALDAGDLTLRGPRHVRAAGGELVAVLPASGTPDDADPLALAVLDARVGDRHLLLGLAAAGPDPSATVAWTDALAVAVARHDAKVLRIDVASGATDGPGLVEVVRDGYRLASVVTFETDLRLARIGAGADQAASLASLPDLPPHLSRDLDVAFVALPIAASRQVVAAARVLDHVLVVAERDVTSRVDLIAALDALEAAGTVAQVVLLDGRTAARLAPAAAAPAPGQIAPPPTPADEADEVDEVDEAAHGAEATESGDVTVIDAPGRDDGPPDESAPEPDEAPRPAVDPPPPVAAPLGPRDVDVLVGAVADAAADEIGTWPDQTVGSDVEDVEPEDVEPEGDTARADEVVTPDVEDEDEAESTDEIPRAGVPDPVLDAEREQDEDLRATAQLATLLEDIEVRGDRA